MVLQEEAIPDQPTVTLDVQQKWPSSTTIPAQEPRCGLPLSTQPDKLILSK